MNFLGVIFKLSILLMPNVNSPIEINGTYLAVYAQSQSQT